MALNSKPIKSKDDDDNSIMSMIKTYGASESFLRSVTESAALQQIRESEYNSSTSPHLGPPSLFSSVVESVAMQAILEKGGTTVPESSSSHGGGGPMSGVTASLTAASERGVDSNSTLSTPAPPPVPYMYASTPERGSITGTWVQDSPSEQ